MKFRTEYPVSKAPFVLSPNEPVIVIGSCFSQNIALKMEAHLWRAFNPFGTLYNPYSIALAIDMMRDKNNGKTRFEESLFQANGIWNSHMFDSSFSSSVKEDCIEEFTIRQSEFINSLNQGKVFIVTFGTSICYYLSDEDKPVGNCHKQPSTIFYRKRLGIEEIVEIWVPLINSLRKEFKDLKIIFTISPIRHLKDGFEGNSRSKAVLQLAVEEICRKTSDCYYFPAYEIVNDDLRDYRFYAPDLVHPSEEAIEYIWEKFKETYVDQKGLQILEQNARRVKATNHRPKTGALGKPIEKGTHP